MKLSEVFFAEKKINTKLGMKVNALSPVCTFPLRQKFGEIK